MAGVALTESAQGILLPGTGDSCLLWHPATGVTIALLSNVVHGDSGVRSAVMGAVGPAAGVGHVEE